MGPELFASVIVPCRNEREYIARCLDSILATTWPQAALEVLVVDGMSEDGTREIVQGYAERHPSVRLVDNPRRIAPSALNIGIDASRGDVILRMDAHATFPPDYIPVLVESLRSTGADNVGGCVDTVPADGSATACAIAVALSHPIGVGNALFRIGASQPRWVDTVPFGCFRRELFSRIGKFDEELVRNQDDEFNHRLLKRGGRILLNPAVRARYYGRRTLRQLARMYYQYGFFKPLSARRAGGIMTIRQIVPAAFVGTLGLLGLSAVVFGGAAGGIALILLLGLLASYGLVLSVAALFVARTHGMKCAAITLAAFAIVHFGYGTGYIRGIWHAWRRSSGRHAGAAPSVGMSR